MRTVRSLRGGFLVSVALILGGIATFFLFLYLSGHDPDERPLTLLEWVIVGILVGPGVAHLINWKRSQAS